MGSATTVAIREEDLQRWRLLERFQTALAAEVNARGGLSGTWTDPARELSLEQYLSLFLFGLFNPVVETMRGLCAASRLGRVQRDARAEALSAAVAKFGGWQGGQTQVREVLVLSSQLRREGPEYTVLSRAKLRGPV